MFCKYYGIIDKVDFKVVKQNSLKISDVNALRSLKKKNLQNINFFRLQEIKPKNKLDDQEKKITKTKIIFLE